MASLVTTAARLHQLSRCALVLAISGASWLAPPAHASAPAPPAAAPISDTRLLVIVDQGSLWRADALAAAQVAEPLATRLAGADADSVRRIVLSRDQSAVTDAFEPSLAVARGFHDDGPRALGLSLDEVRQILRGNEAVASEIVARPCAADDRLRGVCGGNLRKQAESIGEKYQAATERTLRTMAEIVEHACAARAAGPLVVLVSGGLSYRTPPDKAARAVAKAIAACHGSLAIVRLSRAEPAGAPAPRVDRGEAALRADGLASFATRTGASLHDVRLDDIGLDDLRAAVDALAPRVPPAAAPLAPAAAAPRTTTVDARPASPSTKDAALQALVERASAFVATFVARAAVVLATERYEQEVRAATNLTTLDAPVGALVERRTIDSEIALVQVDDEEVWLMARDIVSVDGRPLDARDRQPLTAVRAATRKEAMRQFKALANQGARFNIGSDSVTRNINMPTLALWFLSPGMRGRFAFGDAGEATLDGVRCRIVAFKERRKPFLLQVSGRQAPAAGRFWIRPDGIVVQTELRMTDPNGDRPDGGARITVSYALSDAVEAWVPRTMEERYLNPSGLNAGLIVAKASYRDYKQFLVDTKVTFPK